MLVLTLAATVVLAWGSSPARAQEAQAQQPCPSDGVITSGGLYSGCVWERTQDTNPAVTVKTSQAVTIEGSTVRGRGDLIKVDPSIVGADLTLRNVTGEALNPDVAGKQPGRFVDARQFKNAQVENNLLKNTAGVLLDDYRGDGTTAQSVKVLRNRASNINGMKSDGVGGYDMNATYQPIEFRTFVSFNKVRHVPGMEVAWNEVINEPGKSKVEDNVSTYVSSGTPESPMQIHDNFIWGAYPAKPDSPDQAGYAGGGIALGDQAEGCTTGSTNPDCPQTARDASSYLRAHDNQVVGSYNYGMAATAGHDNQFFNNRIVASGKFKTDPAKMFEKSEEGTAYFAGKGRAGGVVVFNLYGPDWSAQTSTYYNNYAYDNQNATMQYFTPTGATTGYWTRSYPAEYGCAKDASGNSLCKNNMTVAGGPIDKDRNATVYYADEVNEYDFWKSKLTSSGVSIGPEKDVTAPTVTSVSPAASQTGVGLRANVWALFSEDMDPASLNTSTFTLVRASNGVGIGATVAYDPATKYAVLNPVRDLTSGAWYTATVKGGTNGAKDRAGNPLAADKVWSFKTRK